MKKFVLLLGIIAFTFISCEGPTGPMGPPGEGMNWFVETYTIRENQWQLVNGVDELNSYFRAEVRIPELTNFVYEDGNVFCYMFQIIDGTEVQTLLPFVLPYGDGPINDEHLWTEIFACDFSPGYIVFYVNYSDFYTNNRPPTTSFRVVLNW